MLTNQEMILYSHAMSEVFNEFSSTDKSFKLCLDEYNVLKDSSKLFSILCVQILLNNFCEQKDEHWSNINNEDCGMDKYSPYDFSNVHILNSNKYSNKKIIKEIRDAIEHVSYTLSRDLSYVIINNKITGFNAKIDLIFFSRTFFSWIEARKLNSFLLDDSNINYTKGIDYNISNLKIYRVIAKNKNNVRNLDFYRNKDKHQITKLFLNDLEYIREERNLEHNQTKLIEEYFNSHKFNKENLVIILSEIMLDDSGFSNNMNYFTFILIKELAELIQKEDITYKQMLSNKPLKVGIKKGCYLSDIEIENMFELLQNYFKIQFLKTYYQNKPNDNEEDKHLRNCLCHARYTMTASNMIIFNDHPNGINNEKNSTYYKVYDIDELYNRVKKECFENEKTYYFK